MTKFGGTVLEFNGNKYNLHQLIQIAGAAPRVDTNGLKFIGKADGSEIPPEYTLTYHNGEPLPAKELVIFKINGAYMVLHGREFMATARHARLLSTPALKKARFEKEEPASAERVLSSSASGAMADKMQQAFVAAPKRYDAPTHDRAQVKQERFEATTRSEAPFVPSDNNNRKTQNSSLSGAHYDPTRPRPTGTSLTQQTRAGYTEMTSHQQQQRRPSLSELTRPPSQAQQQPEAALNHPTGMRPRAHQFGTGKKKA